MEKCCHSTFPSLKTSVTTAAQNLPHEQPNKVIWMPPTSLGANLTKRPIPERKFVLHYSNLTWQPCTAYYPEPEAPGPMIQTCAVSSVIMSKSHIANGASHCHRKYCLRARGREGEGADAIVALMCKKKE